MMLLMKRFNLGLALMLFCILLSACGPSPEEQAATAAVLTAAAATNTPSPTSTPAPTFTPTPTPTPTPVPYDLSLLVVGEEDAPILGAKVVLAEIDDMQNTDNVGQAFWYDLPGETVNLSVSAQGYFPQEITDTITRGVNQLSVNLDRDPHGILPSEACGPGEKLLYLEDFQDGEAQGWAEIEFRALGWDLIPQHDSQGNLVSQFSCKAETQIQLQALTFEDAVWRIRFMPHGKPTWIGFSWYISGGYEIKQGNVDYSAYGVPFSEGGMRVMRSQYPFPEITLLDIERYLKPDVWHVLEISTYFDTVEVWLDGNHLVKYNDPQPLPGGALGLELQPSDYEGSWVYFDNLSVCELSAPYVPKPTPEP
jgi:hypothetical protein